jgi:hypothetical protein
MNTDKKGDEHGLSALLREAIQPSVSIGGYPCSSVSRLATSMTDYPAERSVAISRVTPTRRFAPTSPIKGEVNLSAVAMICER